MKTKNTDNSGSNVVPTRWNHEFAERLSQRRKEKGLEQQDLADISKVKLRTIQNYESGRGSPTVKFVILLAKALKCKIGWLLIDEDPGPDPPVGDEAPKTVPIYNKVENAGRAHHVAAPESEFDLHGGYKRRQVGEDYMYAGKVLEILAQKNAYSIALINNINAFYNAVQAEKELKNQADEIESLKNICNDLYERMAALEKKKDEDEKIKKS